MRCQCSAMSRMTSTRRSSSFVRSFLRLFCFRLGGILPPFLLSFSFISSRNCCVRRATTPTLSGYRMSILRILRRSESESVRIFFIFRVLSGIRFSESNLCRLPRPHQGEEYRFAHGFVNIHFYSLLYQNADRQNGVVTSVTTNV